MHQTKYRSIITEARSLMASPWEPAFQLVKPLRKFVSPFGGDLCLGWLGSLRLYLYKPLVHRCINNQVKLHRQWYSLISLFKRICRNIILFDETQNTFFQLLHRLIAFPF